MAAIRCPGCGMKSPEGTLRCDCGRSLQEGVESGAPRVRPRSLLGAAIALVGALLVLVAMVTDQWFIAQGEGTQVSAGAWSFERCVERVCERIPYQVPEGSSGWFLLIGKLTTYLGLGVLVGALAVGILGELEPRRYIENLRAAAGFVDAIAILNAIVFVAEKPVPQLHLGPSGYIYLLGAIISLGGIVITGRGRDAVR